MGNSRRLHAAEVANYGEVVAVGRPVGPLHILEDFARSAAGQRRASQSAHADPGADGFAVEQDCHFRGGRNGHKLRAAEAHGARFGSFRAGGEHVVGFPCQAAL